MGSFYFNYTLKGRSSADVARALKGHKSLVTPVQRGCVVVFLASPYAIDVEPELPREVSRHLRCPLLSVANHDDDILTYTLFIEGKMTDEYNSNPDYFDTEPRQARRGPTGGDASLLCKTFESDQVAAVERILRSSEDTYIVEMRRHEELVRALGASTYAIGLGYEYAMRGDLPPVAGLKLEDMIKTE